MEGKNRTVYLVIFIIIALLLLTGIIFWFWWGNEKSTTSPTPTVSKTPTQSPSSSTDPYAGWKTFTNSSYSYSIRYPASATLDSKTLGCVTITTQYGHVIIRGKGYEEICGRTGVGSEYQEISEEISVQSKTYTSTGFKSNSLNPYDEFLMFTVDDGSAIDYGIDDFNRDNTNLTYETVKTEVKKIVGSYQEK